MRAATRFLAALGVLLIVTMPALSAQHPHTRKGFWIGFGFGGGSAGVSCTGCTTHRETGFTGFLKMGGTLSPKVLLGGESSGWAKKSSGVTTELGSLAAAVYVYPAPASGFFAKIGPSFAVYREDDGTNPALTGTGFGFVLGAGYDVRVGANISITPVANFQWGSVGELTQNNVTTSGLGLKQNIFDFGLGITFH